MSFAVHMDLYARAGSMLARMQHENDALHHRYESTSRERRALPQLDVARGLALIAMTTFHFSWDLEFFGYAEPA